ncbi:asparagine synthase (glutamine-hydrolyzing) [Myxococcota bacterium]|nr:asparagine synthase (glutamine-hydrolyzing) [Myxococcota bacterium]MBU1379340.1 asparagine synthase (glutamine-hydrolyzing) [Myxococcota bacterium]MBU1497056.1 asparagine synthase (glutamine-hydrolyzing) [Myxococcota bacterium]
MCGITGFLDLKNKTTQDQKQHIIDSMTDTLIHRGPDDRGTWIDNKSGIALGHRRLSIIDLSPHGHQPMHSHTGRYVLVFNGEIYNFLRLKKELEINGPLPLVGTSDTEIMLFAFERWGITESLKKFNGMFAFALWDREEQILYLGRDRMGEKPLYWGIQKDTLLFGSELKALMKFPGFSKEIDRDVLGLYLQHNCVPAPWSIFKDIFKLPQSSLLKITLRDGYCDKEMSEYWSIIDVAYDGVNNPFKGTEQEAVELLDEKLRESIEMRMISDVPLGAFLSGGIDSSVIVSIMQQLSSRPVKTFTIGFDEKGYNEAPYAKQIANYLGTDHTELYVTPKMAMEVIPLLPQIYDEPHADSSQIPTYLVSSLAKQHVTVALSGDGGDELFAGYNRHYLGPKIWNIIKHIPFPVRQKISQLMSKVPDLSNSKNLPMVFEKIRHKIIKSYQYFGSESPFEIYKNITFPLKNPDEIIIGWNNTFTYWQLEKLEMNCLNQIRLFDSKWYLSDDVLAKVDRASMKVSLETRVPLLDKNIIEFSWTLDDKLKIKNRKSKLILKEVLFKYIPENMMNRPKKGFAVPVDSWVKNELKEWVEELLTIDMIKAEGYFKPESVKKMWEDHKTGRINNIYQLWSLISFQSWKQTWI